MAVTISLSARLRARAAPFSHTGPKGTSFLRTQPGRSLDQGDLETQWGWPDIDGDGKLDLVVGEDKNGVGYVYVFH